MVVKNGNVRRQNENDSKVCLTTKSHQLLSFQLTWRPKLPTRCRRERRSLPHPKRNFFRWIKRHRFGTRNSQFSFISFYSFCLHWKIIPLSKIKRLINLRISFNEPQQSRPNNITSKMWKNFSQRHHPP